jgi:hypothetical protein
MAVGVCDRGCSPHGEQEAERQEGARDKIPSRNPHTHPVTYFLQPRPHLLKFPEPPKIVPPAGDLRFNT